MMNTSGLSLEQAPPISVPFRFFVVAPLLGMIAALTLGLSSPGVLASRWSLTVLAATHLFFLGFLASVMMGALFQILPVLTGSVVKNPGAVSTWVLLAHVPGTLGLAYGLGTMNWKIAGPLVVVLLLGLAVFVIAVGAALAKSRSRQPTARGIQLAILGLLITVGLGGLAAAALSGWYFTPFFRPGLTDLHLTQAFLSWVFLLIASVAFQVVPMFYVTRAYPRWVTHWLAPATFILILFHAGATLASQLKGLPGLLIFRFPLILPPAFFAVLTLRLIAGRRRKVSDPSLLFWQIGLWLALLGLAFWLTPLQQSHEAVFGLICGGAAAAIVAGMLVKIIAFLVWFHLQAKWMGRLSADPKNAALARFRVPNMKQVVPDALGYWSCGAFAAGFILSGAAVFLPWGVLTWSAAAAWLVFFGLIEGAVLQGIRVYRSGLAQLAAK